MSGNACSVDTGDSVQLVTGYDVADSWDEYDRDSMFNYTARTISNIRGDSLPFIFAATGHVYEIDRELVGLSEYPRPFLPCGPERAGMDSDRDTCRVCGDPLRGVERKRGTCKDCSDGRVQK